MSHEPASLHSVEPRAAATTTTLVVVDDSPGARKLLKAGLRRDNRFRLVAEGADGIEAVQLAKRHRPDMLLLDISMPVLGGIDALPAVRAASPDTSVVLYTAHDDADVAQRAHQAGAVGVISKSAPIETLGDRLAELATRRPVAAAPGLSAEPGPDESLRQSEERFRLLVESVDDYAIFMLDPEGVITSWNSGAERIKGYEASEIIGQHFRVFYPEEKQLARHPEHELVVALAEGHFEEEGWRVRKDGSVFWANVVITAVYDRTGRHIGFAKVTRDVTERRIHLQERERHAEDLGRLNAELGLANERLRHTAEERAHFLAVTAHELRTPINVIRGSADTLARYWGELKTEERLDLLGTISTSAGRLTRLLNDLLTAARLETGVIELDRSTVDLGGLLSDAVASARAAHPGLETHVDCEDLPAVLADRDRLSQSIDNLIQNAFRHGRPPVSVSLRRRGDMAQLRVADSGPGVPPDRRDRLFKRFSTGSHRDGTGLGLFITRELARAHGGDAWYDAADNEGRGSFVLSVPLDHQPPS